MYLYSIFENALILFFHSYRYSLKWIIAYKKSSIIDFRASKKSYLWFVIYILIMALPILFTVFSYLVLYIKGNLFAKRLFLFCPLLIISLEISFEYYYIFMHPHSWGDLMSFINTFQTDLKPLQHLYYTKFFALLMILPIIISSFIALISSNISYPYTFSLFSIKVSLLFNIQCSYTLIWYCILLLFYLLLFSCLLCRLTAIFSSTIYLNEINMYIHRFAINLGAQINFLSTLILITLLEKLNIIFIGQEIIRFASFFTFLYVLNNLAVIYVPYIFVSYSRISRKIDYIKERIFQALKSNDSKLLGYYNNLLKFYENKIEKQVFIQIIIAIIASIIVKVLPFP